ncbi:h/ACA ribonucleoprotein complex subunit 1-like protein [Klebsormidium nitens]|uniref:H/ACA ribonucleoprotein complex subunit n=1 Tax=Klebsormidium nitens TaxID=105231 RepID=A0A1Y1HK55_KLENI|nr:h/ACA ribonucleoprotein complex subunit 1-like protein [Klebsormidium nitens]|eukprot:GAQ78950.1 h/ACA ribonucleoprotein complex subunit 1-like protein [Klebsormidium nitens]
MRPPRGGGAGFRGGGGGRGGGFRGGGGGGFRGGGRGGGGGWRDEGPPSEVVEVATYLHACEGESVVKLTNVKIPYFNAPIYLENKTQIGKVEEIFGPINDAHFSIKMEGGVVATSYRSGDKFYIDPAKLLPLERFLPQPKGASTGGRGGGRGGRGGRGGGRGGRGGGGGFRGGRWRRFVFVIPYLLWLLYCHGLALWSPGTAGIWENFFKGEALQKVLSSP